MRSRAYRRHQEQRIRAKVAHYIRNRWSRPDSFHNKWVWEEGRIRYALNPNWREDYENWLHETILDEASHRPHFCYMCRRPRYNRAKAIREYEGPWSNWRCVKESPQEGIEGREEENRPDRR